MAEVITFLTDSPVVDMAPVGCCNPKCEARIWMDVDHCEKAIWFCSTDCLMSHMLTSGGNVEVIENSSAPEGEAKDG